MLVAKVCWEAVVWRNSYFGSMKWKSPSLGFICCLFFQLTVYGQHAEFLSRQPQGKIDNVEIHEASGLLASQNFPGHFWAHNDSGDDARLFLIDGSAKHRATFYLAGVTARDWEDIAWMDHQGRSCLLIADIGDNAGRHDYVLVHRVEEPLCSDVAGDVNTISTDRIQSFILRYEDGPRDAEALFFDRLDGALYVISKRELEVGIYRAVLPNRPVDTLLLEKVGKLPHTFITGADIRRDGTEVLAKNLMEVFYWKRDPGESIVDVLYKPAIRLPYIPEPQGEAIAFDVEGKGYYTLSEKAFGMDAYLYYYQRNIGENQLIKE